MAALLQIAYADDAFLLGDPEVVAAYVPHLERVAAAYGWELVVRKCHAWVPVHDGVPTAATDCSLYG
eukprot:2614442-Alexandrium_andersonii.AAC.1